MTKPGTHEFRIIRDGEITPADLNVADLGPLLMNLGQAVAGDSKTEFLSLTDVKNKCVSLMFTSSNHLDTEWEELAAYGADPAGVKLSPKRRRACEFVNQFLSNIGSTAELYKSDHKIGAISPKDLPENKGSLITFRSSLYGMLLKVGGKEPKAFIQHREDYLIACDISKELARELAIRLYERVGVKGVGKRDYDTGKIINYQILSILPYQETDPAKAFAFLRANFGNHFAGIDPDEFVQELRTEG